MTSHRLRRASALGAASLLAGAGLVGLSASPAFATSVSDEAALNLAIVNGDAVIDLTANITLSAALTEISSAVVINGNGFTIDADGYDAFDLSLTGSDSVTISDLTIVDPSDGIYAELSDTASLIVTGVDITGASSDGVYVETWDTASAEFIEVAATGGEGYGFYLDSAEDADATFEVTDSSATGNEYGLYFYGYGTSTATVTRTDLSTNDYYGLYTDMYDEAGMTLSVFESTINDNGEYGAYLCDMAGTLLIEDTTIDGNASTGIYGYVYSQDAGQLTLSRTTVSNNGDGGIDLETDYDGSTITLLNSTISGNDGNDFDYAAVDIEGDGDDDTGVYVYNSTITENVDVWAGLYASDIPTYVSHSIISGNEVGEFGDLYDDAWSDYTIDWSIVSIYQAAILASELEPASVTEGDGIIISTEPGLGALADNGGPTLTHLPADDSIAVNAGNPDVTGEPETDQRGLERIVGSAIDIGAVELEEETLAATGAEAGLGAASGVALLALGLGLIGYRLARRRQTV